MKRLLTLIPALAGISFSVSCTTTEQETSVTAHWGDAERISKRPGFRGNAKRRTVRTTAYSHMEKEPGAPGRKNAIGTTLRYGQIRSAAADWSRYPLGTQFRIIGQPHIYEIDDFGSALAGTDTIDLFKPTLGLMREWGVRQVDIEIIKWGSYERSAAVLADRCHHSHCRCMYRDLQPKVKRQGSNPGKFCLFCRKPN